jgi:NFU1 iron-sulfur cluster scaffold homolog, mitochondrial
VFTEDGASRERRHPPLHPLSLPNHHHAQQFSDIGQAKGSKLVRRLLKIEQVTGVFLGRDFISVNKKEETPWTVRGRRVVRQTAQQQHLHYPASHRPRPSLPLPPSQPLKPIILDAIMDAYNDLDTKGVALVDEVVQSQDTKILPEDDEVVAMIKELLETRIRPAVQEDGGDIFLE